MNYTIRKFALAALCWSALTGVNQAAPLLNITGVPDNAFTYGTNPGDNNVINFGGTTTTGSTVVDPGVVPSTWLGSGGLTNSFVSVTNFLGLQFYIIGWTYLGSESDNTIQFTVPNAANVVVQLASPTSEDDRNNNCSTCQPGHQMFASSGATGLTAYSIVPGTNIPAFTLTDVQTGTSVTNGGPNGAPGSGIAGLIFSYAQFDGTNYRLTSTQTDTVVFGFNDDGSGDDNHDDFVGVMRIVMFTDCPGPCLQQPTPVPSALPLFGSALGGALVLLGWHRKRREATRFISGAELCDIS